MAQKQRPQAEILSGSPQPNFTGYSTSPVLAKRAPTQQDTGYPLGQMWLDKIGDDLYGLVDVSAGVATWNLLAASPGEIATITGDSGGALTPTAGNINILGSGTISTSGAGSTLTIEASASGYPISPYVVGPSGQAGYQTIQSAINAANGAGGGTVYIQPGTYTENLTLYSDVDLVGAVGVADTGVCTIIGQHTPPAGTSGGITINNIFLQSATNIFNSVAAGSCDLILINVAVSVTNGYTFNLPNWTGGFVGFDVGEIGSTNDGWVNNTGGATVFMTNVTMGAGSVNSMITSGFTEIYDCVIGCPVNFQTGSNGIIDGGSLFQKPVTFSNNSAFEIANSNFQGGASAAITYSSSGNSSISNCVISSSNNPAIAGAGAGTLTLGSLTFLSNANIAGTLTTAWSATKVGAFTVTGPVTTSGGAVAINSGTNALGISTDAAATTVNVGTGAGAKTITIGSTNTTSATNLTAGSGGVNCATDFALTSVATKISMNGGAVTDFIGTATLTNGVVVIANTNIAAGDRIFLSRTAANASTALGMLTYSISAGASFTVTALETATPGDTEVNDQSSFAYIIFRQT